MKEFEVLISHDDLYARIKELAEEINNDFEGEQVTLICILKGAVMFFTELSKHLRCDVVFDFMQTSSYGNGRESSGNVLVKKDLEYDVAGKNVIVIEDIIDTGHSLATIKKHLETRKPKSLKLCTLLDKPSKRENNYATADYSGFEIPDEYVVGFGLDDAQIYRNLDYIGIVNPEND